MASDSWDPHHHRSPREARPGPRVSSPRGRGSRAIPALRAGCSRPGSSAPPSPQRPAPRPPLPGTPESRGSQGGFRGGSPVSPSARRSPSETSSQPPHLPARSRGAFGWSGGGGCGGGRSSSPPGVFGGPLAGPLAGPLRPEVPVQPRTRPWRQSNGDIRAPLLRGGSTHPPRPPPDHHQHHQHRSPSRRCRRASHLLSSLCRSIPRETRCGWT